MPEIINIPRYIPPEKGERLLVEPPRGWEIVLYPWDIEFIAVDDHGKADGWRYTPTTTADSTTRSLPVATYDWEDLVVVGLWGQGPGTGTGFTRVFQTVRTGQDWLWQVAPAFRGR